MDNKMTNNNDEIEIDLKRLFQVLLKKAWLIGIVAVVCAVCTFLFTYFFIRPEYQSSAMLYVNNSTARGESYSSITTADINASRGLVKSYLAILNTRETMEEIADYAQVDLTYAQIQQMISADSVDSTEIIEVIVTADDPEEAQKIADAVTYVLPNRISSIIEGTSAKVVASAVFPQAPSSPSYAKNTLIGFLVGLVLSAVFFILRSIMDVTLHTEEDISQVCSYPLLASVPDMTGNADEGRYSVYGGKKKEIRQEETKQGMIGGEVSFLAAEAYKLLRTKLQFSFADENQCHVIGVCSAMSGEGKSLSAVNLAYTAAQLSNKVLLIDCDMRRPSVFKKLPINQKQGLSEFLSGQSNADGLIQLCGLSGDEHAFHVISSGRTPPNPVELLSSVRMKKMLEHLREHYEYIILDLPPVGEVSDALAVAGQTDGMIIVIRQDYCNRNALSDAIRQLEFVGSRILGVVFNCTVDAAGMYTNGKYDKQYGKKYTPAAKRAGMKTNQKQKNRKAQTK